MPLIYFSGGSVEGQWRPVNELLLKRGAARLLSFANPKMMTDYCALAEAVGVRTKIMIDSGAFSAWTNGARIDLEALSAAFDRLRNRHHNTCEFVLVNLDVIPGRSGRDPSAAEIADAVRESEANFSILDKRFPGVVLPVFHQGEPPDYFHRLVGTSGYVCLSPRNDLAEKYRVRWAKDLSHRADVLFHGLAATGNAMRSKARFDSVDSATWVKAAAMGNIFWPTARGFDTWHVSSRGNAKITRHIDSLTPRVRTRVAEIMRAKGYEIGRLRVDDTARYRWNAEAWLDLAHPF